ncbi:peptidoglycan-binding domain-containing protein [Streptomyces virginiae]|uniref:peptidoglycan-binding domain-containing protein n=1 Tax=Streptomyces virginiae TaxID=1961 RepID=UPI00224E20B7|nr:peptidoglycan-binding domain-containing protein [Streptomyces virginiae]MCX4958813.1 peptidoglycan-binding protein [Streptomyces virginiae]
MSGAEQVVERTEAPAAPEEHHGGLARGRRVVLAVVGGAALMAVGGLLATTLVKSPAQVAAETGPPAQGVLTADVERRVLAQTVVMRGTVVADQSVAVSPQGVRSGEGAGAALVTKLPLKAGDPVTAGRLIAEVSGRPVFTLHGAQPMYRDLKPGSTGDDVAQLQQALRELGHGTGGDAKGVFGAGTKAALTAHYRAIGYAPLPAVADGGAALKAAREAVRSATWAVEDASSPTGAVGTPEETGSGRKGGATADPGATASPGAGRELARARQALGEARAALAAAEAADGPMLPTAEAVFLSSLPARVSSVGARAGSPVSGPVLTLSGGELVVEAYLKDDKRQLLRAGMTVVISSEVSGTDVRGTVAAVATERSAAQPAGPGPQQDPGQNPKGGGNGGTGAGGGADLGYRLVVRADQPLPAGFAGQDVRLTIESAATDGEALVVPITAVSAGADGRTVVTAVSAEGTQRRIEVRTGTSGDGFVAVTPAQAGALGAGTKVVIGVAPRETRGKSK